MKGIIQYIAFFVFGFVYLVYFFFKIHSYCSAYHFIFFFLMARYSAVWICYTLFIIHLPLEGREL